MGVGRREREDSGDPAVVPPSTRLQRAMSQYLANVARRTTTLFSPSSDGHRPLVYAPSSSSSLARSEQRIGSGGSRTPTQVSPDWHRHLPETSSAIIPSPPPAHRARCELTRRTCFIPPLPSLGALYRSRGVRAGIPPCKTSEPHTTITP